MATQEEDGLGTKLPKGFVLKIRGPCEESTFHTGQFGYTVRCPLERTLDVRTGDARQIKFINQDAPGNSFTVNGIHHWAWHGKEMYCFPADGVTDGQISELFPPGSTMKIELVDGGNIDDDDSSVEQEEDTAAVDNNKKEEESCEVPDTDGKLHVFLIGNSYTRQNDLTKLTKGVFHAAQGGDTSKFDGHCPPGSNWGGHYNDLLHGGEPGASRGGRRLHSALVTQKNRQWNWVILQNQSQLPAYIQDNPDVFNGTVGDCKNMYQHIQDNNPGVKIMFYMTWGRCRRNLAENPEMFTDYLTNQAKLVSGYLQYQKETTTPEKPTYIAPVGLVFQQIYQDLIDEGVEDPTADGTLFRQLYWRDRHHPSLLGSYVAAMTIFASITGNFMDLPDWIPNWETKGEPPVDPKVAKVLRQAVVKTIEETSKTGLIKYPWQ